MTSARSIKDMGNNCDGGEFDDLKEIKSAFLSFIASREQMRGLNKKMSDRLHDHVNHDHISRIRDIVATIECKLNILSQGCPEPSTRR